MSEYTKGKWEVKPDGLTIKADALLDACKLYQKRIELFRKMNPDIIIKLGSGLGLTQAEDKGKQAIAQGEGDK